MRFVLFCEGWTESGALPAFLGRWLNSQLPQRIGIKAVRFNGWPELVKDSPRKATLHLRQSEVIAVIALLDLYGPTIFPVHCATVAQRHDWAKKHLESKVNHARFHQYFAVHEIEAWILSQPHLLPPQVQGRLPPSCSSPETINSNDPPSRLLERLYSHNLHRSYKKVVYGNDLFDKLDPVVVREKCPYFRQLSDDLVSMARKAVR